MALKSNGGLFGMTSHNPVLNIYEDAAKKWRWDIKMGADIVAASSQGYASKQHCIENINRIEEHIKYLRTNDKIK